MGPTNRRSLSPADTVMIRMRSEKDVGHGVGTLRAKLVVVIGAGVLLAACGGGGTRVIGTGAKAPTTAVARGKSAATPTTIARPVTPTSSPQAEGQAPTPPATGVTPLTPAFTKEITSELRALNQDLKQAGSDLSPHGTGGTT
jgi:hypothetical protein